MHILYIGIYFPHSAYSTYDLHLLFICRLQLVWNLYPHKIMSFNFMPHQTLSYLMRLNQMFIWSRHCKLTFYFLFYIYIYI